MLAPMAKSFETGRLSWPGRAPWALPAAAATSILSAASTPYDIL